MFERLPGAIRLAYLLTDGDFSGPGNEKVVEFCKKMTADGRCKINTIAYIPKDGKNPELAG